MDSLFLAAHLHDANVSFGLRALGVTMAGAAAALAAYHLYLRRNRWWWPGLVTGLAVLALGGTQLVEASARRHNHICHNHHANGPCGDGPSHLHYLCHDHGRGRSAAEPPPAEERRRDLAELRSYPDHQNWCRRAA